MLIAAASVVLQGCQWSDGALDEAAMVSHGLDRSPSYQRVQEHAAHPSWVIDDSNDVFVQVAIGENRETYFSRWNTLRLYRDGSLERLEADADGEDIWVVEAHLMRDEPRR